MFARIEVATRPEFADPAALGILRKVELAFPGIRSKIRWARLIDVYWLDLPFQREELIPAITQVFLDRVLQWIFTGNLIPSAAGHKGGILDLLEGAPHRQGKFLAIERCFRPGVTDNVGRTTLEAFEIVLGRKILDGRCASGSLLLLEGADLDEDVANLVARDVFCNKLIETWAILAEGELSRNDRFQQERVKYALPKVNLKTSDQVEKIALEGLSDSQLETLSQERLWALSLDEMKAVRNYYHNPDVRAQRIATGLAEPTDVELEIIAQTWSEHCKHKIFNAEISYLDATGATGAAEGAVIPGRIDGLFQTTIAGTTAQVRRPWLLSVFEDNAGIVAIDDEDAFCIKVETHNSPSALDPYGGALTGIIGVNRDILGCGLGAKPIFNTDVFCLAPPDYPKDLPDRLMHPRRILEGVRRGVEHGGNKSGVPTVNGALVFDESYLGKPLIYCGTGGIMPRMSAGRRCEVKEILPGDRICMVGGRIGKDGIHGATFSSLALNEASPVSAVQLGDPITQKRMADFLLEARDLGFYRAITDNGAGGLSSSVGELAKLSGGARIDVSLAKTKYPGLKPFELVISESQERMTVAVPPERLSFFLELAERRGVEVSDLGEFTGSGRFEVFYSKKIVGSLDLKFLHQGVPRLKLHAEWKGPTHHSVKSSDRSFELEGAKTLTALLSRPNIASKEWLIRQYDHEVQGMSVIKPLHTTAPGAPHAASGPNDAAVLKPKSMSEMGLVVGCGIIPRLSEVDPYSMAQMAVDEAVRNVLCVGAEFGRPESVLALVDNFCWPDPVGDPGKTAALVRACFGLRDAALGLSIPLVSGKDSMKNDFRGKLEGKPVTISVVPTLLMTAIGRMADVRSARTSDFKMAGDAIYLLGGNSLSLIGSEYQQTYSSLPRGSRGGSGVSPSWAQARRIYGWIGGSIGKEISKLRSLHDISDGGLLVAVAEGLIARNLGASLQIPVDANPWEFCYGEGFHSFVASVAEADSGSVEREWAAAGVPFKRIGSVTHQEKLEVTAGGSMPVWNVATKQIHEAWAKEGCWE